MLSKLNSCVSHLDMPTTFSAGADAFSPTISIINSNWLILARLADVESMLIQIASQCHKIWSAEAMF
jgi:hypothetical protein